MWKDSCAMFGSAIRRPSNSPYTQLSGMAFFSAGSDVKVWFSLLLVRYVVTWIRSFWLEKDLYRFLTGWERSKYNIIGFGRKCQLNNLRAAWLVPLCWHEGLKRKRWSLGLDHSTLNSYSRGHLCAYRLGHYFSISKISKDPSSLKTTSFSSGQTTCKDLWPSHSLANVWGFGVIQTEEGKIGGVFSQEIILSCSICEGGFSSLDLPSRCWRCLFGEWGRPQRRKVVSSALLVALSCHKVTWAALVLTSANTTLALLLL